MMLLKELHLKINVLAIIIKGGTIAKKEVYYGRTIVSNGTNK